MAASRVNRARKSVVSCSSPLAANTLSPGIPEQNTIPMGWANRIIYKGGKRSTEPLFCVPLGFFVWAFLYSVGCVVCAGTLGLPAPAAAAISGAIKAAVKMKAATRRKRSFHDDLPPSRPRDRTTSQAFVFRHREYVIPMPVERGVCVPVRM